MNTIPCIINGKHYDLPEIENWCVDETLHDVAKFGKDKSKCLANSTFRYTEERRAIFDKVWRMLYE